MGCGCNKNNFANRPVQSKLQKSINKVATNFSSFSKNPENDSKRVISKERREELLKALVKP